MTIKDWLSHAQQLLQQAAIPSARLDCEILLAHTIKKSRTYLHAHGEEVLEPRLHEIADARLALREDRTTIAYIIGHKEFYGRLFKVTTATLIPRPESETIISLLERFIPKDTSNPLHLIDIGTGSGCLGITAKLEFPFLDVTLSDISRHALVVAKSNAKHLKADVQFAQQNLLSEYYTPTNYIIANLPYVDKEWERSPETNHEPSLALFADENGLALIYKLLPQAMTTLLPDGYLFLEADPCQHEAIMSRAKRYGLIPILTEDYIVVLQKPATNTN